ncbi:MAG: hypothetical protein FDZ70_03620, partial [Actinobacteria bacterium]
MTDNVGNPDARPDLELEGEFGEAEGTITEQEMAEAEAGCGQTAVGIPMGHPGGTPAGHPGGTPVGHPSGLVLGAQGAPAQASSGHPAGVPMGGHPG